MFVMNYKSTRDVKVNVPSAYAISQGLSSDGGLFVPENLPKLSEEKIMSLCDMSYAERAYLSVRLSRLRCSMQCLRQWLMGFLSM